MTTDTVMKELFETVDAELFWYLYSRWQDEKQYEDPMNYVRVWNEKGGNLLCRKMYRRPFGFEFELNGVRFKMTARVRKGNGTRRIEILGEQN